MRDIGRRQPVDIADPEAGLRLRLLALPLWLSVIDAARVLKELADRIVRQEREAFGEPVLDLEVDGVVIGNAPPGRSLRVPLCPADCPDLKPQRIELEEPAEWNRRSAHAGADRHLLVERIAHLCIP